MTASPVSFRRTRPRLFQYVRSELAARNVSLLSRSIQWKKAWTTSICNSASVSIGSRIKILQNLERRALAQILGCIEGPASINLPVPQTLDPFLKLYARIGVDLACQLGLVVSLQHVGVVLDGVRRCCRVGGMTVAIRAVAFSTRMDAPLALRHLEAKMHATEVGSRRGGCAVHGRQATCDDGPSRRGK